MLGRTKEKEEIVNKPAKKLKGSCDTLTLAAKKKPREEVVVIDYTKKRGSGKKRKDQEEESEENTEESPGLVGVIFYAYFKVIFHSVSLELRYLCS